MDHNCELNRPLTIEERLALLGVEAIWDGGDHFRLRPLLRNSARDDQECAERAPLTGGGTQP